MDKINEFLNLLESELNESSSTGMTNSITLNDIDSRSVTLNEKVVKTLVNKIVSYFNNFDFKLRGLSVFNISVINYNRNKAVKVSAKINSFRGKTLTKPLEIIIADEGGIYFPQSNNRFASGDWSKDGEIMIFDEEADAYEAIAQAMAYVELFMKLF